MLLLGLSLQLLVHGPIKTLAVRLAASDAGSWLIVLSLTHLLLGAFVFVRAGGRGIVPTGVYFFATVFYFGYGGIARAESRASVQYLLYASLVALTFNLVVLLIVSRSERTREPDSGVRASRPDSRSVIFATPLPWLLLCAAIWATLTVGAPAIRTIPIIGSYVEFLQVAASLLLAQAYLAHSVTSGTNRAIFGVAGITALSVGAYVTVFYSGYARIVFAGFMTGLAILIARRYPRLPVKISIITLAFPLVLLAATGERTGLSVRDAAEGFGEARGVTSMTGVLPILAETLERHDTIGLDAYAHRNGRTFFVSAVHWIPREWWAEKPIGPEIELAQLLRPEVFFGHSIVGSNIVEWLLNFDIPGIVVGMFLTGLLLARLDRWVAAGGSSSSSVALRALVSGNLVIYVWAGSFSYSARTFIGGVMLLLLARIEPSGIVGGRRTRPRSVRS